MSKAEIRIPFGVDQTNRVVHISEVERGRACGCTCPACSGPLMAVKGSVRQHHFRHAVEVECEGAAESAIHLAAKQLIMERRELTLSPYVLRATRMDKKGRLHRDTEVVVPDVTTRTFDSVAQECEVHGMRADLLAVEKSRPLMIEIRCTHAVDEEKRAKIRAANISAVEIDLSDVADQVPDWASLWVMINDPARMTWLYNPREEEARARLEGRLGEAVATGERAHHLEVRERGERQERQKHLLRTALMEMNALSTPAKIERLSHEAEQHHIWQDNKQYLPFEWTNLPPFLNVPVVNGDWIYGCDRRVWQLALYRFFSQREGKKFSVRQADRWLKEIFGLKVPCVQEVGFYGPKYPDVLRAAGLKSVPCTWTTLNAFCQDLCERRILAYSVPHRDHGEQLLVFRPKDRTEHVSQAAGRISAYVPRTLVRNTRL